MYQVKKKTDVKLINLNQKCQNLMFCTKIRCVNLKNLSHSFAGMNYQLMLKKRQRNIIS